MQRRILIFVLTILAGSYAGGLFLIETYKKESRSEQSGRLIERSTYEINQAILAEMLSLKRIASQLKASDRLTDYTNLGQDQMTEAFLYPLMQNIPHIRIDTRDFEGDLIASAGSGASPEIPDYLLKNSLDGQQIDYFQVTNGEFWYSYATQIGDQDHIAGLLILHKNLDSILTNLSHHFSGIWLSVVSQDQPDYSQAPSGFKKFINEFKLNHRKPPSRLVEGVFETHTSVILPEQPNISKVRFLLNMEFSILFEPLNRMQRNFNYLFLFILSITLMLTFFLTRSFHSMLYLLTSGPELSARANKKLSRYPVLYGQYLVITKKFEGLNTQVKRMSGSLTKLNTEQKKLKEIASIDDTAYKIFLDSIARQKKDIVEKIFSIRNQTKNIDPQIINDFLLLNHTIGSQAHFFQLKSISSEISSFESYIKELQQCNTEMSEEVIEEIATKMESVLSVVESYSRLRKEFLGKDSSKIQLIEVTPFQTGWLKSLINCLGQSMQEPVSDTDNLDKLSTECSEAVSMIGHIDIRHYLPRYNAWIKEAIGSDGKDISPIIYSGNHHWLSYKRFVIVNEMIIQALKNCVVHGIENAFKRKKIGKEMSGNIKISMNKNNESLEIRISDDGQGISEEKILETAVKAKIITEGQQKTLEVSETRSLVFDPRFCTEKKSLFRKNQGMGLTSVQKSVTAIGGDCQFISGENLGSTLKIRIPEEREFLYDNKSFFNLSGLLEMVITKTQRFRPASIHFNKTAGLSGIDYIYHDQKIIYNLLRTLLLCTKNAIDSAGFKIHIDIHSLTGKSVNIVSTQVKIEGIERTEFVRIMMNSQELIKLFQTANEISGINIRPDPAVMSVVLDISNGIPPDFQFPQLSIGSFISDQSLIMQFIDEYKQKENTRIQFQCHDESDQESFHSESKPGSVQKIYFMDYDILVKKLSENIYFTYPQDFTVILTKHVSMADPMILSQVRGQFLILHTPLTWENFRYIIDQQLVNSMLSPENRKTDQQAA